MGKYALTRITGLESSQLRTEFESYTEEFAARKIDLQKVTSEIVDLQTRPEYSPEIRMFQLRRLDSDLFYVFNETIYTSNEFVDELEQFIRSKVVPVRADKFEEVPKSYKHFFETPYTIVPVDVIKTSIKISNPDGSWLTAEQDTFEKVDFSSSCTLKMLEPGILFDKLEQIEKAGNFSVVIKKSNGAKDLETVAFEYRRGNEHKTIEHLVFRG
ncbi:hypothetical protein HZC30_06055 [Candidatus Woesearchaeota archaeon]|nr:hypothetical protein [Candidatus Woesearchaeota archaeon]